MNKMKRMEQIERAITEIEDLVVIDGRFHVSGEQVAPVLEMLRRKLEMLRQQFEAEWAAYIDANQE
jgi:hypothetical protein